MREPDVAGAPWERGRVRVPAAMSSCTQLTAKRVHIRSIKTYPAIGEEERSVWRIAGYRPGLLPIGRFFSAIPQPIDQRGTLPARVLLLHTDLDCEKFFIDKKIP
jgi:hypothetical protein